jgi:AcrR family transcriptional regulator
VNIHSQEKSTIVRSTGVRLKVETAAIALFAEKGVAGVSIGEIAAAAGVSQGALYRHYAGKDELARSLFGAAYFRTGAELDAIRDREPDFARRVTAMVAHFCALYDRDPALFRFMLIAQHGLLPEVGAGRRTPVDAIADSVADGVRDGAVSPVDPFAAAAAIIGIVLQTAVFHIYGLLRGPLTPRARGLAGAALAAVAVLGAI